MYSLRNGRLAKNLSGTVLAVFILGFFAAFAAPSQACIIGPRKCNQGSPDENCPGGAASCRTSDQPTPAGVGGLGGATAGGGGTTGGPSWPSCPPGQMCPLGSISTADGNAQSGAGSVGLPEAGGGLLAGLVHNAQSSASGPAGPKWTHSYNMYYEKATGVPLGKVKVTDWDGTIKEFHENANGSYTAEAGVNDKLEYNAQNDRYILTRPSQRKVYFYGGNQGGLSTKLEKIVDDYNVTYKAYYDGSRLIRVKVEGKTDQDLDFGYDTSDRLTSITDPAGNSLSWDYDAAGPAGRPWHVTRPGLGTYVYEYYGDANRLNKIWRITEPSGAAWQYDYDNDGRIIQIRNPLLHTTSFSYVPGATTITYPGGRHATHTYDANGNLIQVKDCRENVWSYEYVWVRNLKKVITPELAPLQKSWEYAYDPNGNVTDTWDPLSHHTRYAYDSKNRVTKITDPLLHETNFTYDDGQRTLTVTGPDTTNVTVYKYEASGNLWWVKNARNYYTGYRYYSENNRLKDTLELYNPDNDTGRLIHHYDYTYLYTPPERWGWLKVADTEYRSETDYSTTYFYYDQASRLREINYPDVGYGRKSKTFSYDCCGVRDVTDENGNTTSYDYDALHRLWKVYDANHPRALGQHNIEYQYDLRGFLWKVNWLREGYWKTITYSHDDNGNLTGIDYPDNTNEEFSYDMDNRKESWTKADGKTIGYSYYENNLLHVIDYPGSVPDVTFQYDDEGRRTTMANGTGTWIYTYDHDPDRTPPYTYIHGLVEVTQPSPGGLKTFHYGYDGDGNRTTMINPSPWNATHTYNYDHDNRLTYLSHPTYGTHTFLYDWLGNRTRLNHSYPSYPNNAYTTYAYNARNWLTSLYNRHSSGSVKCAYDYLFDHVGNRTTAYENDGVSVPYRTFTYDNLYQLKTETKYTSGGQVTYAYSYDYDEPGNIKRMVKDGSPTDFTYDDNNKVLRQGTVTYGYDDNGNIKSRTVPGQSPTTYDYDDENRMTGITYPNATTASFQYNGDGLRVRVREPDAAEEDYFLYDGVRPYMRMESAQGLPRAVYVSEGGTYYSPIVTLRTANANWTYLRDGMESVRKILNESQTTTDAYSYEAFGNPTGQAGTTVNRFRYVGALGYYSDRTTSLRLLGARYYGPSPRRFWTQDPVGAQVNQYAYVSNNPLNVSDPGGLFGGGGGGFPKDPNITYEMCVLGCTSLCKWWNIVCKLLCRWYCRTETTVERPCPPWRGCVDSSRSLQDCVTVCCPQGGGAMCSAACHDRFERMGP